MSKSEMQKYEVAHNRGKDWSPGVSGGRVCAPGHPAAELALLDFLFKNLNNTYLVTYLGSFIPFKVTNLTSENKETKKGNM